MSIREPIVAVAVMCCGSVNREVLTMSDVTKQTPTQQQPRPSWSSLTRLAILAVACALNAPVALRAEDHVRPRQHPPKAIPSDRAESTELVAGGPDVPPSPDAPAGGNDGDEQAMEWQLAEPDRCLIDLTTALQLATQVNPQIGLANESIREALALELAARAMLLPTMTAGTNYHLHTGPLQTSFGLIRNLNEQSIYFGGGARSLAAETVGIPAVRIFSQLSEALYAPLSAVQVVAERNANSHAVANMTLLDVVTCYLQLTRAETRVEALRLSLEQYRETVRLTKEFAKAGQGRDADYNRARSHGLLVVIELQQAEEEAVVASAKLSRLLRLDQSVQLETPSAPLELIVLTPLDSDLPFLVDVAHGRRPELKANGAAIGAAEAHVKLEVARPWLPTLSAGYSVGGFGGGSNQTALGVDSMFQTLGARTDLDVFAFWQLQNMGAGNHSLQKESRAIRDKAIFQRALTLNVIRREVAEAHANIQSARQWLTVSQIQLATAEKGADEDLIRTRAGEGLPIVVLNSLDLLTRSRLDLVDAVTAFNLAQFQMFVVLGESPLAAR